MEILIVARTSAHYLTSVHMLQNMGLEILSYASLWNEGRNPKLFIPQPACFILLPCYMKELENRAYLRFKNVFLKM